METGYVLVGDEQLPYTLAAIHAAGLSHGDRVHSMELLAALSAAEEAVSAASAAIGAAIESSILSE